MTKDEALRLALEALKEIIHWYAVRDRNDVLLNFVDQNPEIKKAMTAITAIEAALEAKDEPVAWVCDGEVRSLWWDKNQALDRNAGHEFTPLYATPPQRKPLTDEEIQQIFIANSVVVDNGNAYMVAGLRTVNIARDIEAAHGIKGEA